MKNYTFATAIVCIDGRTQIPVITFLKKRFAVDYIDMITEPGPDKILSRGTLQCAPTSDVIESIKKRALISVEKHKSKIVIIAGHHDCTANPVGREEHYRQIRKAVQNVRKWNLEVGVYGLWVNEKWQAVLL